MTFDDDFMRFMLPTGVKDITCKAAGIDWPPPLHIEVLGLRMKMETCSAITDEQRQELNHVIRAARYVPADKFH